jgi:FtsP/CotA-like multicopper oxidase with cupredoxin domain
VHSKQERASLQEVPYMTDQVVMLQDWYHDISGVLLEQKLAPGSESSPVPDSALINGRGVVDCSVHANRRCDNKTLSFPSINLTPQGNHRLRIINVGGYAWFEVTADQHPSLSLTEIDGVDIVPSEEQSVVVGPGQRYSTIINTSDINSTNSAWLRARIIAHCFGENVDPAANVTEARAIIRHSTASSLSSKTDVALPTTQRNESIFATYCADMDTRPYAAVQPRPAPEHANRSWNLQINMEIGDWRLQRGFVNGSTYRERPSSPTLHRVVAGLHTGNASFDAEGLNAKAFNPRKELVISQNGIEVVDLVLQNLDEENHPFHLHGHQMFVLATGHGYFPGYEALGLKPEGRGLLDPGNSSIINNAVRRDVATVPSFGWSLIRFIADNPGLWLFHCHVLWHSQSGMAMQFLSRRDVMRNWTVPAENMALCGASAEELETGLPAKDSTWFGKLPPA